MNENLELEKDKVKETAETVSGLPAEIQDTEIAVSETAVETPENKTPESEGFSTVFDAVPDEKPEINFIRDFTVSDIKNRAKAAQKGNLLKTTPKALLYMVCMMIPTLLIFILGSFKLGSSAVAGRAIEVIAVLFPVVFGGPLTIGFLTGILNICRGEKFKVKNLFSLFADARFGKTAGVYIIVTIISFIMMFILQLPMILITRVTGAVFIGFIYEIACIVITMLLMSRFALAFPLIADHPELKIFDAIKSSFEGMRGNSVKLLLLLLSYIGWYLLYALISAALIGIVYAAGTAILMSMTDFLTYYMAMLRFMLIFYISAYLIMMITSALMLVRPAFGFAAFYDTVTGREWPVEPEIPADPYDWDIVSPQDIKSEDPAQPELPKTADADVSDGSADESPELTVSDDDDEVIE